MQVSTRRFLTPLRQRTGYPFSTPPGGPPPPAPQIHVFLAMLLLTEHMPRRTSVCRKSDMRRPKCDKRSELAVKYCCRGSVHRAKPEFKVWQRYPAQTCGRLAAKDFVPSVLNASSHCDGRTWSLELFIFLPDQPRQRPFYICDGRGVGAFASNCPIAGSQTWTGGPVKLFCRECLALSTAPSSVMSPSKVQL
jgi:hypothetical protein